VNRTESKPSSERKNFTSLPTRISDVPPRINPFFYWSHFPPIKVGTSNEVEKTCQTRERRGEKKLNTTIPVGTDAFQLDIVEAQK